MTKEGSIVEIDFKTTVWYLIFKIAMDKTVGDISRYVRGVEMLEDILELDRQDDEYQENIKGLDDRKVVLTKNSKTRSGSSSSADGIDAQIAREKFRIILRLLKRNNIGPPKEIIEVL